MEETFIKITKVFFSWYRLVRDWAAPQQQRLPSSKTCSTLRSKPSGSLLRRVLSMKSWRTSLRITTSPMRNFRDTPRYFSSMIKMNWTTWQSFRRTRRWSLRVFASLWMMLRKKSRQFSTDFWLRLRSSILEEILEASLRIFRQKSNLNPPTKESRMSNKKGIRITNKISWLRKKTTWMKRSRPISRRGGWTWKMKTKWIES